VTQSGGSHNPLSVDPCYMECVIKEQKTGYAQILHMACVEYWL